MILDGILIVLLILAFIRGWKKGLLWAVGSLIAVLLGVMIALKLSHSLADYLFRQNLLSSQYTLILCFVLLFIGTIFLFRSIIKFIESFLDKVFLGWANNMLGGVLYSFFTLFVVSSFLWLVNQSGLLNDELKKESNTYTYVEPISVWTIKTASEYLPYCKSLWNDIQGYFEKVQKKYIE